MSYGLRTYNAAGVITSDPTLRPGGFFVGTLHAPGGSTVSQTYADVTPGTLRVYQATRGYHTPSVSGNTVTLTPTGTSGHRDSLAAIFTTKPVEPTYGISVFNNFGDLQFSTKYPSPEYLGRVTLGAGVYKGKVASGHNRTEWFTASVPGAGRTRMILWIIPDGWTNLWWKTSYSYISGTSGCGIDAYYGDRVPVTPPQGLVFALDGITASASNYGIRVFDGAGGLTFDGGLRHWNLTSFTPGFSYPNWVIPGIPVEESYPIYNPFVLNVAEGIPANAAIFFSDFQQEKQVTGSYSEYVGVIQRKGNNVYGGRIETYRTSSTDPVFNREYGQRLDIPMPIVDGSLYT